MIKILVVTVPYKRSSPGGAAKSFLTIFNGLKEIDMFQFKLLELKTNKIIGKFINPLGIGYFIFIPKILQVINKYKPDIIITQSRISFSAIFAANLKKIPIINIIRDNSDTCPKHLDIIEYGKACLGLKSRKICYNCINYWRTLRVLIGNKTPGWEYSMRSYFSMVIYKIRYFTCLINFALDNRATVNLVASELIKKILSNNINSKKIKIANITPVKRNPIVNTIEKKNQLLFIIPKYNASYKGLIFILKLSHLIPKNFKILIVGNKISEKQLARGNPSNIINLDQIELEELNMLYKESKITLVPSFVNESFGRIIIESLVNKTPVISSPHCGANYYFKDKEFINIIRLKLSLWIKTINEILQNPYYITDEDVNLVYDKFSVEKSIKDFINLIKTLTRRS